MPREPMTPDPDHPVTLGCDCEQCEYARIVATKTARQYSPADLLRYRQMVPVAFPEEK
jgi:hypothetical protein